MAAAAQAVAIGGGLGQMEHEQVASQIGWGWAMDEGEAERVALLLESAHASAGIEPSACFGTVPGEGQIELPITLRPGCEQSLRRNLAVLVQHGSTSYVGVRSEVVQRRACLSLTRMDLGTSYVRVAVQRAITLTNLTNIDTEFQWHAHVKKGSANVRCSPSKGMLGGGQQLTIQVEAVPTEDGVLDVLMGCELQRGFAKPIGFRLQSAVQGLTILYQVYRPDDPHLTGLSPTLEPRAGEAAPDASGPMPNVDFGKENPIFEAKQLVVVMRNLSAVRTMFRLSPAKYGAAELPAELQAPPAVEDYTVTSTMLAKLKKADALAKQEAEARERAERMSSGEGGTSVGGSTRRGSSQRRMSASSQFGGSQAASLTAAFSRPTLTNAHEQSQPFFSQTGVTFSAQRSLRQREAALLAFRQVAHYHTAHFSLCTAHTISGVMAGHF